MDDLAVCAAGGFGGGGAAAPVGGVGCGCGGCGAYESGHCCGRMFGVGLKWISSGLADVGG